VSITRHGRRLCNYGANCATRSDRKCQGVHWASAHGVAQGNDGDQQQQQFLKNLGSGTADRCQLANGRPISVSGNQPFRSTPPVRSSAVPNCVPHLSTGSSGSQQYCSQWQKNKRKKNNRHDALHAHVLGVHFHIQGAHKKYRTIEFEVAVNYWLRQRLVIENIERWYKEIDFDGMDKFLPRDAMRKRGLCCRPVSVRPSVTLVYCIQTAEYIVRLLSRSGSPIILVFFDPEHRNLFSVGDKYTGLGKFCDFRLKSPFISETVRDRPMVAMER